MESIFIVIVVVLMVLAVSDLIVGVSNDAVNFLNGAVGSKAASLRVILIVAAAGVLAGATFSNGMMEVARKGLFYPTAFSYKDVMIIFLSVMLTDVILLDLFNTFGLPTSTTVSMVFELLGAAVGIAIVKILHTTGDFTELGKYINSAKALAIISGILVSVVIAFSFGAIIQWFSRLLFTFSYEKNIRYFGGIFGGFAVMCIMYFILIKGLKDSVYANHIVSSIPLSDWATFLSKQDFDGFKSLIKTLQTNFENTELAAWGQTLSAYTKETYKAGIAEFTAWAGSNADLTRQVPLYLTQYVNYYTFKILFFGFIISTAIMQLLNWLFKMNILKFVVLLGTFALAMAFAGNDLVNFIGVPLAGLAAHQEFAANAGANPEAFLMGALMKPVATPTMLLLIAGLIMVITLWLSKKARRVIKTSLDLSDQDVVHERFESNALARGIVRQSIKIGSFLGNSVPQQIKNKISKRFDSAAFTKKSKKDPGVSFDLIRGAVTLVVASALIAFGTSLKLPLSTTYVTFMVAMGTSLADGAWDRESAVYRVTGVITVIGGWFFTAISAFTVALIVSLIIIKTWWIGVFVMIGLALFLLVKSHLVHKAHAEEENKLKLTEASNLQDGEGIYEICSNNIISLLIATSQTYAETVDRLRNEKRKKLKDTLKTIDKLNEETKKLKKRVPSVFRNIKEDAFESGHHYSEIIDYAREAMHCLQYITAPAFKHVDNNHKPLNEFQIESLQEVSTDLSKYFNTVINSLTSLNFKDSPKVIDQSLAICENISRIKKKQFKSLKKEPGSSRTNLLYLDMLNETRNLILNINNMYKSFRDFSESLNQSNSI
ncbi:MAG: inorganic phosphate transporter [Bacteroidales bacterium]|nr:inorganic phosphate transporter [Bacteroidales bacterium]